VFPGFSKAPFFSLRTEPHLPRRRDHVSITLGQSIAPSVSAIAAAAAFFKRCTLFWPRCRRSFQALLFFFTTPIELGARLLFVIRRQLFFFFPSLSLRSVELS